MKETVELLLRLIEKEEGYHQKKETMAWIAGGLYFSFSILMIHWLMNNQRPEWIGVKWAWLLPISLVAIWAIAIIFISWGAKNQPKGFSA